MGIKPLPRIVCILFTCVNNRNKLTYPSIHFLCPPFLLSVSGGPEPKATGARQGTSRDGAPTHRRQINLRLFSFLSTLPTCDSVGKNAVGLRINSFRFFLSDWSEEQRIQSLIGRRREGPAMTASGVGSGTSRWGCGCALVVGHGIRGLRFIV